MTPRVGMWVKSKHWTGNRWMKIVGVARKKIESPYGGYEKVWDMAVEEKGLGHGTVLMSDEDIRTGRTQLRGGSRLLRRDPGKRRPKKLTAAARKRLPSSAFALPERRALPIHNAAHVRNAAARLAQMKKRGTVTRAEYTQAKGRIEKAEKRLKIGPWRKRSH